MRRIVGQCSQVDFRSLEHLGDLIGRGEEVDLTTLSKTQKAAIFVLGYAQKRELPPKLLQVLREVLIWGEGKMIIGFEYKFYRDPKLADDIAKFMSIMR